jgi:fucose permease
MFTLAGFGGACVPWLVGFWSTRMSSLKLGLIVPVIGCAAMLALYLRTWQVTGESKSPEPEPR